MKSLAWILAWSLLPFTAFAEPRESVMDPAAKADTSCLERNIPEPDSVRGVRIASKDRAGQEREFLAKIYGRRVKDDKRQVLIYFLEPADIKGASLLLRETAGDSEMYFRTGNDAQPRKLVGHSRSLAMFGTDFSYEDFEHFLAFRKPEEKRRLEDDSVMSRPVYVVETRSADSAYDRIVTSIDKQTCVAIRTELYEKGGRLRKELTLNPSRVVKRGDVWLPQAAVMSDLRDSSSTVLLVDSMEQDVVMDEALFRVDAPVAAAP